jgi:hypothetical protein
MVSVIQTANLANAVQGVLVSHVTADGVCRVRGIHHNSALAKAVAGAFNKTLLRM